MSQPTAGTQKLIRALRRYAQVPHGALIIDRLTLFAILMTRFSMDEISTLMFCLNLTTDQLPHESHAELVRNLITFVEKSGRYNELVAFANDQRPEAFAPKARAT